MRQKTYFKKKAKAIKYSIWDMEFKRFKALEIREEYRQQRDQQKGKLFNIDKKIEEGKKSNLGKDEMARLDDQKVVITKDIERLEMQIRMIDGQVNGIRPSETLPDGQAGLADQIDALRELRKLTLEYIKQI